MTELFEVPAEASFESVRRQLSQWHSQRVALVLPDGWLEMGNVARLRLLQRQAVYQQVELALVSRDPATQSAAKAVGLPIFSKVDAATGDHWHMAVHLPPVDPAHPDQDLPDPPPWRRRDEVSRMARPTFFQARQHRIKKGAAYQRPTPAWVRWAGNILLGALIVALLAGFTFYVLPAATVTLTPARLPLKTAVNMSATVGMTTPDIDARQLPARTIKADLVEKGTVPATGSSQKATDKAVGEVVFSNLGSTPVTVPAGTLVTTSSGTPVEFRTTRDATLESGVGARVTVPIEAVEPGTIGNVRANTINTVNGSLRFRVRVNNSNGTGGGGSALVPTVTQADKDKLSAQLQAQAQQKAYDTLKAQLQPGEWLPPESVQTFVVAQSYDQYNDEEATQLSGTVRVLAQGVAVDEKQANDVILAALEKQVPDNARLAVDSVSVQREPGANFQSNSVSFTVTVGADYTTPINPDLVRDTVLGHSPQEATRLLKARWSLQGEPDIYLDPAWKGTLPNIPSRIQVRVNFGQP